MSIKMGVSTDAWRMGRSPNPKQTDSSLISSGAALSLFEKVTREWVKHDPEFSDAEKGNALCALAALR